MIKLLPMLLPGAHVPGSLGRGPTGLTLRTDIPVQYTFFYLLFCFLPIPFFLPHSQKPLFFFIHFLKKINGPNVPIQSFMVDGGLERPCGEDPISRKTADFLPEESRFPIPSDKSSATKMDKELRARATKYKQNRNKQKNAYKIRFLFGHSASKVYGG